MAASRWLRPLAALIGVVLIVAAGAPAAAQPTGDDTVTTPVTTPDTSACPHRSTPPPPVDTSEVPRPGRSTPDPVPVPDEPVGGGRLDECGVIVPDGAAALPDGLTASAWVLADVTDGVVLAAKDPHGRYRPASTIKTLLAAVALQRLDPARVITATAADAVVEGSAAGIGAGGTYTNYQLLQGLLMASGNDAAHAIAAQLGGEDRAAEMMTSVARDFGARDTRVARPSGLDGPGMSTSAYDMALILTYGLTNPTFRELISTPQAEFPGYPADGAVPGDVDRPGFTLGNDNQLLHNYPGALGGKTGFTDDARHTFVGAAERDGRTLVVTVMAAEVGGLAPWQQAAALLDWGFAGDPADAVGTIATVADLAENPTAAATSTATTTEAPPLRPTEVTDSDGSTGTTAPGTATDAAASGDAAESSMVAVAAIALGAIIMLIAAGIRAARRR
ncbi:D-alanyl-D-alanine carboxypeptidase family protein [Millisia brevis]|uniref:D-alanyl-D-alanine carboxypeptidase family protein n=1 Tax=Millisia brevis TaxID=264148 RepID=UPI000A84A650|nr:serine hydrolase [Millisia brevis]